MAELFDYPAAKADADEMIAEFGQTGTLVRPVTTGPVHNPVEGTPLSYPVTFVVIDWTDSEIAGGRVLMTDKKVILAKGNLVVDPTPTDRLVIGGVSHAIIGPDEGRGIRTLAPSGIICLYELQARA